MDTIKLYYSPDTNWSDENRRDLAAALAKRLQEQTFRNTASREILLDGLERIQMLLLSSRSFLENNRDHILNGNTLK